MSGNAWRALLDSPNSLMLPIFECISNDELSENIKVQLQVLIDAMTQRLPEDRPSIEYAIAELNMIILSYDLSKKNRLYRAPCVDENASGCGQVTFFKHKPEKQPATEGMPCIPTEYSACTVS